MGHIRILIPKRIIVIKWEKASQYSLWWKFDKTKFWTNPYSTCKGLLCVWSAIFARNGNWIQIFILKK